MKLIAILLGSFCFHSSVAQRIFYTSQQVNQPYAGRPIQQVHPHWLIGPFGSAVTVVYADGARQSIKRDSLWGFEKQNKSLYRCYQQGLYRVKYIKNGLVKYRDVFTSLPIPAYSKTLDSPLYGSKQQARETTATN